MPAGNSSSRPGSGRSSGRSNSSSSRGGSSRPSSGRGGASSSRGGSSSRGSSSSRSAGGSGGRVGGAGRSGAGSSSGRASSGRPSSSSGRPSSSRPSNGRPSSGRPSSGQPSASGERRSPRVVRDGEERSSRSYGDRPSSGRPSSGGRAGGSRSTDSHSDRPSRPSSGRSSSGRPTRDGAPRGDRSTRPYGDRPNRDGAPRGDRRTSDRTYGDRPVGDRESRPRREWSRDERPKASDDRRSGGRPDSRGSDRPRRDDRGSDRGGFGDRPLGGRPDRAGGRFQDRDERPRAPRGEKRVNVQDPIIPDHITGNELPRNVRNELRTLPDGLALRVARHLAASGAFMDSDPELAWEHAKAALNKASRVGIIREAAAEAAYNAGHFAEALTEFRAARRMRGIKEYWPLMADCERALGRPEKAIAMAGDPLVKSLDRASRVEMRIVAAGARVDQKKLDAALATLQCPELTTTSTEPWAARIRYAYADVLAKMDRKDEAIEWFHRAAAVDLEQQTDADERVAELEGRPSSDYDYEDFEDEVFEDWEDNT